MSCGSQDNIFNITFIAFGVDADADILTSLNAMMSNIA